MLLDGSECPINTTSLNKKKHTKKKPDNKHESREFIFKVDIRRKFTRKKIFDKEDLTFLKNIKFIADLYFF